MRKITYSFNNNKYIDVLEQFCEDEGFVAQNIDTDDDIVCSINIFFITDNLDSMNKSKSNTTAYLISENEETVNPSFRRIIPPFNKYTLRMILNSIYNRGASERILDCYAIDSVTKSLTINNKLESVEKVAANITKELIYFCNFGTLLEIRIGLSELITNAIEHGNLGITSKEKGVAINDGSFSKLIEDRMNIPTYANRKTTLIIKYNTDRFEATITDEGEGFSSKKFIYDISMNLSSELNNVYQNSPKNYQQNSSLDRSIMLHGRGIILASNSFDKIKYNDKGNSVTVYKSFNK